jgi:hypothetical protein
MEQGHVTLFLRTKVELLHELTVKSQPAKRAKAMFEQYPVP